MRFFTGLAILEDGHSFDPSAPYRACLICGAIRQTHQDKSSDPQDSIYAAISRQEWAIRHARTHPLIEHTALKASGHLCTPEAAEKLAGYGLIDITGMILSPEIEQAYRESKANIEEVS